MSAEHPDFEVRQAPDRIDARTTMVVTIASIVVTAVALVVAWGLLEAWGQEPRTTPPPAAPRTIGILEQTPILTTERGVTLRAEQRASLERWGWADRDAGVARIPIDQAIELFVAEHPRADEPLMPAAHANEAP